MVIQRLQSLLLLIAVILIGVFCFTPFATIAGDAASTSVYLKDAPAYLALNIVIAVVMLITIFMYKNLRQQMRMTILSIVLICVSLITGGFIIAAKLPEASPVIVGGLLLPIVALVLAIIAHNRMKHDHKLLTSMDRLR